MGYESKLIIGERHNLIFPNGSPDIFFEKIAEYDLSCMEDYKHFHNKDSVLFKIPIDFNLYMNRLVEEEDFDEETSQTLGWYETQVQTDDYENVCHYAPIEEVLNYLKEWESKNEYYRRVPPLIAMLESFVEQQKQGAFKNLIVVQYGH